MALLQSLDQLSVRQLKNVLAAKMATESARRRDVVLGQMEKLVEKPALLKLVQEHVSPGEVEQLLRVVPTPSAEKPAAKTSSKSKNSNSSANPPMPSPAQLRQQAAMIRKNPDLVRRSQPAFSKMTDAEIRQYADQLEQAASDPQVSRLSYTMVCVFLCNNNILLHRC